MGLDTGAIDGMIHALGKKTVRALGHIPPPPKRPKPPRANAEIKRLLCMANETYDPAALNALTRALIAQGFGK